MHDLALYRKYRPKTFKEVVGQEHIVSVLEKSIKDEKVSHAYLFVGSRGTGKTTIARIFARDIGVSENDIYEIDAASNRKVEEITSLRDGFSTLPFDSKYKVYILDEVHMFSKESWNMLLKTLEEPPKHVIFIMATTELRKVPDTIVSRCQTFTFKKPSDAILKNVVLDIADKEGYILDAGGAELIALLGDGSFRDAEGVLQKVLNFSKGKKIKREDIEEITGAPKTALVNDFISAIAQEKLEEGILVVRKASNENLDMKLFAKLIIQRFRVGVILKYAPNMADEMAGELSADDLAFLKDSVKDAKSGMFHSSTLIVLLKAYQNMDRAFITELPLEIALIEILG